MSYMLITANHRYQFVASRVVSTKAVLDLGPDFDGGQGSSSGGLCDHGRSCAVSAGSQAGRSN